MSQVLTHTTPSLARPQIRVRCFLIAALKGLVDGDGLSAAMALCPKPTHVAVGSPRPPERQALLPLPSDGLGFPPTVGEAIDDLPPLAAGEGEEESFLRSPAASTYQWLLRGNQRVVFNHVAANTTPLSLRRSLSKYRS